MAKLRTLGLHCLVRKETTREGREGGGVEGKWKEEGKAREVVRMITFSFGYSFCIFYLEVSFK